MSFVTQYRVSAPAAFARSAALLATFCVAAFAVASLLALLGLVTLALKTAVEWKVQSDYEAAASE